MSHETTNYYISEKNSDMIVDLREGNVYSRRFRKEIAPKYFNDCPDLIDKINTRDYFSRYDIESVVNYYNQKCK